MVLGEEGRDVAYERDEIHLSGWLFAIACSRKVLTHFSGSPTKYCANGVLVGEELILARPVHACANSCTLLVASMPPDTLPER